MSKVPSKKWKKDSKFKLKARMQEINMVQEYEDVDLHHAVYEKGAVSRIMTDKEVRDVIGKLQRFRVLLVVTYALFVRLN